MSIVNTLNDLVKIGDEAQARFERLKDTSGLLHAIQFSEQDLLDIELGREAKVALETISAFGNRSEGCLHQYNSIAQYSKTQYQVDSKLYNEIASIRELVIDIMKSHLSIEVVNTFTD